MAYFSKAAGHIKLQGDEIVTVMGVKGKVTQVMVMRPEVEGLPVDVLVVVDMSRGTALPNVFNLNEIESVKGADGWYNLKGELVH